MSASGVEAARAIARQRVARGLQPILLTGGRAVVDNRDRAGFFRNCREAEERHGDCDAGRGGEVGFFGEVDASAIGMRPVIQRIATRFDRVHSCYEPGSAGGAVIKLGDVVEPLDLSTRPIGLGHRPRDWL
jgi:transposase